MSEITKALVRFQRECPTVVKDKTATAKTFTYTYADLATIMSTIRPALSSCGLFVSQSFEPNGITYLVTTIMHESGEQIHSKIPLPLDGLQPQAAGSAITYYRRFAIMAILGIAAENDDDDGKKANDDGATHKSNNLRQQLVDSIELESNKHGFIVALKYADDPEYAEFIKDTPSGKCWKLTAIANIMRKFVHDLADQYDSDEFVRFLQDNKYALDACATAMPNWYYGKPGSDIPGIEKRISDKKLELNRARTDDPSTYMGA